MRGMGCLTIYCPIELPTERRSVRLITILKVFFDSASKDIKNKLPCLMFCHDYAVGFFLIRLCLFGNSKGISVIGLVGNGILLCNSFIHVTTKLT